MGCHDVSHARSQSKRAGTRAALAARTLCGLLLAAAVPGARAGDDLPRAQPEVVGMSSARLQRLSRRMQEVIDNGQVAGIVTLVARHGQVVHYEAQGYRNREEKVDPGKIESVEGVSAAESDDLIDELTGRMIQPDAEYRHKWRLGDIVIWDNRCTMHKANGDYPAGARRVMHRMTTVGTAPF